MQLSYYLAKAIGRSKCAKCGKNIHKEFVGFYREDEKPPIILGIQKELYESTPHYCSECLRNLK